MIAMHIGFNAGAYAIESHVRRALDMYKEQMCTDVCVFLFLFCFENLNARFGFRISDLNPFLGPHIWLIGIVRFSIT